MIELRFIDYADNLVPTSPRRYSNNHWKSFMFEQSALYPDIIVKKPKGNGTYTKILGWNFQATSGWSLYIWIPGVTGFSIGYNQLKSIQIHDDVIIINEVMAIKQAKE